MWFFFQLQKNPFTEQNSFGFASFIFCSLMVLILLLVSTQAFVNAANPSIEGEFNLHTKRELLMADLEELSGSSLCLCVL